MSSGDWFRWNKKTTIEECLRIEMPFLKKMGYLDPISIGTLSWNVGGNPSGSVRFNIDEYSMELNYKCRKGNEEWEEVKQLIRLVETPCNYGGFRKWFECPNCHRRVGTLCSASKYFLCRHCYTLTYASCSEHWIGRITRKQDRIKKKLGGNSYDEWIPKKPKGMHWKTYKKYRDQYLYLDDHSYQAFNKMLMKF